MQSIPSDTERAKVLYNTYSSIGGGGARLAGEAPLCFAVPGQGQTNIIQLIFHTPVSSAIQTQQNGKHGAM